MSTKTLFAWTDPAPGQYPRYVNATRTEDGRLRLIVRAPAVDGREGSSAAGYLEPAQALDLARQILLEFSA